MKKSGLLAALSRAGIKRSHFLCHFDAAVRSATLSTNPIPLSFFGDSLTSNTVCNTEPNVYICIFIYLYV